MAAYRRVYDYCVSLWGGGSPRITNNSIWSSKGQRWRSQCAMKLRHEMRYKLEMVVVPCLVEQEQSETAYVRQGECGPDPMPSVCLRIRITTKITATSLFKVTSVVTFLWKSDHFIQRYKPNCGKMPYIAMLKNLSKNSWIRIRKQMTSKIESVLHYKQYIRLHLLWNFREDPFSGFTYCC